MELLNYDVLKKSGYEGYVLENAPVRMLQFGEGNFLRAFVDYFFDLMNEKGDFNGKVQIVQPIPMGRTDEINAQQGLYNLYLRGSENGQRVDDRRVISSVAGCLNPYADFDAYLACAHNPDLRFIASNTTEAGIAFDPACKFDDKPAASFPGKLTQFLYERWKTGGRGFWILSCELIDNNGRELLECVRKYCELWKLEPEFTAWVERENHFCSTLVDRIVTGYPRNDADAMNLANGFIDQNLVTAECFGLWVIEAPDSLKDELPIEKAGLPIVVAADHTPYKQRKVRILNGAHTGMILGAYLAGQDIVRDCMHDSIIRKYTDKLIFDEIIPSVTTLPAEELKEFAASVADRFENPYIDHRLLDIALNSVSKWRARVMPSLLGYLEVKKAVPACISFSFAALLEFYARGRMTDGKFLATRGADTYEIRDDQNVLDFFVAHSADDAAALVAAAARETAFWGRDLSQLPGFEEAAAKYLCAIRSEGAGAVMQQIIE
ncbi:MAG: tagaturonate reductase [Ruminococcaceae bacterium]|nr:tagaturonate reductase [Oscillospiraceae bacterium]